MHLKLVVKESAYTSNQEGTPNLLTHSEGTSGTRQGTRDAVKGKVHRSLPSRDFLSSETQRVIK